MGTWGPGIFDDDLALDVSRVYEDALAESTTVGEATHQVLDAFSDELTDFDDGPVIILALANIQMQRNEVDPVVRERAIAVIDSGQAEARWKGRSSDQRMERRTVLLQLKEQLEQFCMSLPVTRPSAPGRRRKQRFIPGDFVSIPLSVGLYGFGRVLNNSALGVYRVLSDHVEDIDALRAQPFVFRVLVANAAIESGRWTVIGHRDFSPEEKDQADVPFRIEDVLDPETHMISYKGQWRPASAAEVENLEPAEIYQALHVEERILKEVWNM